MLKPTQCLSPILILLACCVTNAEEPADRGAMRDPWNGFPKGSWIILTDQMQHGEKEVQRTEKIVRKAGAEISLERYVQQDGTFSDTPKSTSHHIPGFDPAKNPKAKLIKEHGGKLSIDGKEYECKIKEYTISNPEKEVEVACTVWIHTDAIAPYRELLMNGPDLAMHPNVLRAEFSVKRSGVSQTSSLQITTLQGEKKIGDRMVRCIVEEGEFVEWRGTQKAQGTIRRWLSHEVPGGEVMSVVEGKLGDAAIKRTKQVTDFHVPRNK